MIQIRHVGLELTPEFRESFAARLQQSLHCLGRRLQKVNAFITDLNGPKGGVDKHCRVVVHLKRQPSLVIEECDSELSSLIDRLIDRLGQTASRLRNRASSQKLRRADRESALKPVSEGE